MKTLIKYILLLYLFLFFTNVIAQQATKEVRNILSFEEYIGYVKQQHPLLKSANLKLTVGEANLLKARGGFDPKIEVDYNRKKFKNIEYYDELNTVFKIPTWYGVEFKANFEENTGEFLNPNLQVPEGGLYSAGVSFSVLQGLLMNDRMATLKKAKFFLEQSKAERDLRINNLIYEASIAYFEWFKAYNEELIYNSFLENAETRFLGVKRSVEEGEKAAIDSIEAKIIVKNRELNLAAAELKKRKASLQVSNYIWLNDIPLEIEKNIIPELPKEEIVLSSLSLGEASTIVNHPKMRSISAKINSLDIDKRLKKNKLLPKLDLQYNFLTQDNNTFNSFNTANYKAGVAFSVPLFLRKERGNVKLANLKLQEANFKRSEMSLRLQNKIDAAKQEISSLQEQNMLVEIIVSDYKLLLGAEERKFELGESSLFLINTREQKLIEILLKENDLKVKSLNANASMYNALGISEEVF